MEIDIQNHRINAFRKFKGCPKKYPKIFQRIRKHLNYTQKIDITKEVIRLHLRLQ